MSARVRGIASVTTFTAPAEPLGLADVQGTLALEFEAGTTPERTELRAVPDSSVGHPDLESFTKRFSAGLVDVLAGDRGPAQLLRCVTPAVYDILVARSRALAGTCGRDQRLRRARARVCSVHVFCPAPDIAEFSMHVRHGERSRAVAGRLELREQQWVCVTLQFG